MKNKLAIHGGKPVTQMKPRKPSVGKEEIELVTKIINEGVLSSFRGGPQVRAFEKAFAEYVGAKYALATTSGTTALHASIAALDLKPGDEVLVPAVTFVSTASTAVQEGLSVVFVDIDENYCMDPKDLRKKITNKSKVIIPVHLYGRPANMKEINMIAQSNGLKVIEDACQSHGAEYRGVKTGTMGDIGCFSFYETKNMTCGEGGMITTSDENIYKQLCLRREHGSPRESNTWYDYKLLGYNYNMTEIQGAVGQVQLKKLDKMNAQRVANAKLYDDIFQDLDVTLPPAFSEGINVYHNYPVLLPKSYSNQRKFVLDALRAEGIAVDVAYPCPLYETDVFKKLGVNSDCPVAEDVTKRLITFFTDSSINRGSVVHSGKALSKILEYLKGSER